MRHWLRWGLPVILAAGMNLAVLQAAAADDDEEAPAKPKAAASSSRSTWGSWFGGQQKPAKKAAPAKPKGKDQTDADKAASKTDTAVLERKRQETALLRRSEVCLKLLVIADETNDEELRQMAEALEERARAAYAQRVAHLPAGQAPLASDEQILDKHLGNSTTAVTGAAKSLTYGVSGKDPRALTAIREEKP